MKCDELKDYDYDPDFPFQSRGRFYVADEERPSIKKIDPYYQLWYRRQKALPIFEAYLHAELERYKLEQKLAEAKK